MSFKIWYIFNIAKTEKTLPQSTGILPSHWSAEIIDTQSN